MANGCYRTVSEQDSTTPPLYFVIHVLMGMLAYHHSEVIFAFLGYQFAQCSVLYNIQTITICDRILRDDCLG